MRLKRLVARGFKSFADRTEFEFDNRLTGIIGPNGCGKSNVVDAIKWVLGDQRAKSLRGAEMTDVIFKGAEGREAMGMAEVTITFEDPDGKLDGRTEIDISRRLTLDKESTYLLNGSEVRLKDIRDVLLDTGLGTGGYSVMEQGRIAAIDESRIELGRYSLAGLELFIVSDIIETALSLQLLDLVFLGLLVAIRSAISHYLEREVTNIRTARTGADDLL
jgi:chromosome segregation protein